MATSTIESPGSHAHRLRLSLFLAAGLSAVVACGEKGDVEDSAGSATSDGGEGEGGEGGGGDEGGEGSDLTAVPEADYPVCSGGDTGGFHGPCCVDVYCIDAASDGSCLSTDETNSSEITGIGLGSGSCECEAPAGPYAPYEGTSGDCCYTVGIQGCEGRPMLISGTARTAPLQRGRSWRKA